jgi:chemotaxis protein methyltransferase CheR
MSDRAIHFLIHRVAERIGFRAEAIPLPTAVQALRHRFPRGLSNEELARRVREGDEELERALLEAVSVGETFFFRQPEHFRFLAESFLPRFSGGVVRAWSAGCATGEEAYSLAACLLANVRSGASVEVLGTDVTERNVLAAARGIYGPWSIRDGGPILYPTFRGGDRGTFVVSDEVRAVTSFRTHNLLDDPPAPHPFDVVFCRNVLLYFSPEAQAAACDRLVESLAPGGLLVFGTLDVGHPPPGTESVGPREANMFARSVLRRTRAPRRSLRASRPIAPMDPPPPPPRATQRPPKASQRPPPLGKEVALAPPPVAGRRSRQTAAPPPPSPPPEEAWISDHLHALGFIEKGNFARAELLLQELRVRAPNYLPGLFELGVLLARRGQRRLAENMMRDLLRRTEGKAGNDPVPGPEELTIAYYRVAAEAYLGFSPGPKEGNGG